MDSVESRAQINVAEYAECSSVVTPPISDVDLTSNEDAMNLLHQLLPHDHCYDVTVHSDVRLYVFCPVVHYVQTYL